MKTHDPTAAAFARLKSFARDENVQFLDRMVTETAAGWLALASCYGVTADPWLLAEIADEARNPVARSKTLSRSLVEALSEAGIPLTPPFQAVEVLYSDGGQDIEGGSGWQQAYPTPLNPFSSTSSSAPRP